MDFLSRIRTKPSHIKVRYAFVTAFSVTLVITFIWGSTLPARFTGISMGGTGTDGTVAEEDTSSQGLGGFLNEAQDQLGAVIESVKETPQVDEDSNTAPSAYDSLVPVSLDATEEFLTAPEASGETIPPAPAPVLIEVSTSQNATSTPQPDPAFTPLVGEKPAPRVILIGTSTSQKSE